MPPSDTTGARIRVQRQAKRWTQTDLARRLKVTQQTVAYYEAGDGHRLSTLRKVAKELGCALADLITDGNVKKSTSIVK